MSTPRSAAGAWPGIGAMGAALALFATSAAAQPFDYHGLGWGPYYNNHLSPYDGRPLGPPLSSLPNERAQQLQPWTHAYNWHRPHGSLKANTPISRLGLPEDNLLRLHTSQHPASPRLREDQNKLSAPQDALKVSTSLSWHTDRAALRRSRSSVMTVPIHSSRQQIKVVIAATIFMMCGFGTMTTVSGSCSEEMRATYPSSRRSIKVENLNAENDG